MGGFAKIFGVLLLTVGFAAALLAVRLSQGPMSFGRLPETVARSLERQFGKDFSVTVDDATVAWESGGPNLAVTGVTVRDPRGQVVIRAPQAEIGFDPWTLGTGNPVPRDISFVGLAVALTIGPDGGVSISASGPAAAASSTAVTPPTSGTPVQPSDTSFGPGVLLDALSSPDGPVAVLERAGVRGGQLLIDDRRRGKVLNYTDFSLGYVRPPGEDRGRLALSAKGPSGRWSFTLGVTGAPGADRTVRLETQNLALAEVIELAQPGSVPFSTDISVSGHLAITVGVDGSIVALDSSVTGGGGDFLFSDPDARPMRIDRLKGEFGWDRDHHALLVRTLDIAGGPTRWVLTGSMTPPRTGLDHWAMSLSSSGSTLAGISATDAPVAIESLVLEGRMPIGLGAVFIDRLELNGPQLAISGDAALGVAPGLDGLQLNLSAKQMPVRKVLAFWPHFITPEVRSYMADNVLSGTVESFELHNRLSAQDLKEAAAKRPLPDAAVSIDVKVTNGAIRPAPGLVTLTGVEGRGHVSGRSSRIEIARATATPSPGHTLLLGKGRFEVADTTQKPAIARVSFDIAGGADALLEVLRSDAMRAFTVVQPDVAGVKGQVEARAKITMPLQPVLAPKDVQVSLQGTTVGLAADNVAGKDRLEAGNLAFTQDRQGLTVKGDARIGGIPVQIDYQHPTGAPAEAVILASLDEAARTKKGLKLSGQVTGIVDVKATVQDPGGAKSQAKIELDLTRAGLTDIVPGWTKPAGKAGKASFRLTTSEDGTTLDDFTLDAAGGVMARGSLRLNDDQGLASAKFTTLKLSANDDLKLDLDRAGAVTRATIRGSSFDARPLLRAIMAPGDSALSSPGDVDIDLKIGTIQGLNGEALSAAELKLALRSASFRDFRLSGRFGSAPLSGQVARLEGGPGIVIESGDGGSFLRFLDIYRRMLGGDLLVTLSGAGPQMSGTLIVNRFVLSNEPALAKSAPAGQKTDGTEAPNNVLFTKLRSGFTVGGGKLVIRDATMWGQAVGGTLDGTLDFTRDQADMSGTFVPAYGLNNIINRVPLVGPILGGGQNEGIFAVNFRISGRVSQPTLSINPLSAVAPGFLRKFFGVFNADQASGSGGDPIPPSRTLEPPR